MNNLKKLGFIMLAAPKHTGLLVLIPLKNRLLSTFNQKTMMLIIKRSGSIATKFRCYNCATIPLNAISYFSSFSE